MSNDEKRKEGGDIFEGLGKKTPEPLPVSPFVRSNKADMKRTMIGIPEPANLNRGQPISSMAPTVPKPVPAPPGRAALPDLDATDNTVAPVTEKEIEMDVSGVLGAIEALGAPGALNPQNTRAEARADAVPDAVSSPNVTQEIFVPEGMSTSPTLEIGDDATRGASEDATLARDDATVAKRKSVPPPLPTTPSTVTSAIEATAARNPKLDEVDWDRDDDATWVYEREAKKKALAEAEAERARTAAKTDESAEVLSVPEQKAAEHASMDAILAAPKQHIAKQSSPPPKISGPPPPPGQAVPDAPPAPPPPQRNSASLQAAFGSLGQAREKPRMSSAPPPPARPGPSDPPPPPPAVAKSAPPPNKSKTASEPPAKQTKSTSTPPPLPPAASSPPAATSAPPPAPKDTRKKRSAETAVVPRQQKSNGMQLAVFALLVIGVVGAGVYFLVPRGSTLVVNVTDPQASTIHGCDVFIDGAKRCDAAPCTVHDLPPGTHELKVTAPGLESPVRTITLARGHDLSSDIQLAAAQPAPPSSKPATPPPSSGTGFKVAAPNPGVNLNVDGKDIGPLPQELHELEPGDHRLRFSGDRYQPMEKTISVAKDEIVDLGSVALKVSKGKATIALGTPGAKVFLINGANRKEVPQFPITLEFDTSEKWDLVATKEAHDEFKERVSFEDGQAEKTFTVTLAPKGSAAPKPAPTPRTPKEPKEPATPKEPKEPPAPKPTSDEAAGETALKINSLPASSITLDGKPIGVTPQPHVPVSPGSHTIQFVNAEQSLKKTITVDVKAGETKAAFAKLRD